MLHFQADDFMDQKRVYKRGSRRSLADTNARVKLKRTSYPTLFGDRVVPNPPPRRRDPALRRENFIDSFNAEQEAMLAEIERIDVIGAAFDFPNNDWQQVKAGDRCVRLLKLDLSVVPANVAGEIMLNEVDNTGYKIKCFVNGVQLPAKRFNHVLNSHNVATKRTQVHELINIVERSIDGPILEKDLEKLRFISEQSTLIQQSARARRFSPLTICMALEIRSRSQSMYRLVEQSLCLPSSDYLGRLTSNMGLDGRFTDGPYLKQITSQWTEWEKDECVLVIDEIVAKEGFTYKAGQVSGAAENRDLDTDGDPLAATSSLGFLLVPVKGGPHKAEMLSLIPVRNLTGDQIIVYTASIRDQCRALGVNVTVVSTDNHQVNRKLFQSLSEQDIISEASAKSADGSLDLIFDFIHWLKTLRSSLLKDNLTFLPPPKFADFLPVAATVSPAHLRDHETVEMVVSVEPDPEEIATDTDNRCVLV